MHLTESLACGGIRDDSTNRELRMGEQETEDFASGIPACADNGSGDHDA